MLIGRVIGNVVATRKNLKLDGEKLLLVQPLDLSGAAKGIPLIAIDRMGAGPKERVLYTQDGRTSQQILARGTAGVDAAILAVIDEIDFGPVPAPKSAAGSS
jgi:ethanolamine utilization protein EutN